MFGLIELAPSCVIVGLGLLSPALLHPCPRQIPGAQSLSSFPEMTVSIHPLPGSRVTSRAAGPPPDRPGSCSGAFLPVV